MKGIFGIKALVVFLSALAAVALQASAAAVTVSWDASPSEDVVGYAVYYGYSSGDYSTRTEAGNQTSLTFHNLDGRTNYFFVATAYTADGLESLPSNEVSFLADTNAPQISVTSNDPTFTTISSVVRLSGVASDNLAIASITWSNHCNQTFGTASGTTDWEIESLSLCLGTNVVTITAQDSAGNIGSASVTILRVIPCSYSISSTSWPAPSQGGQTSVSVSVSAGCEWTASSSREWLTVSVSGGVGSGSVTLIAAANPGQEARSGTVTLAGKSLTVSQAGTPCAYALSSSSANFTAGGGSGSVNVAAGSGCSWNASSPVNWITISSGGSGTGNGIVDFSVSANTNCAPRSGILTIAGNSFAISQSGGGGSFSISPTGWLVGAQGGQTSVEVNTSSDCAWTAFENCEWLTLSSPGGTGSSKILVSATTNPGTEARSYTATLAGKSFTVTQAGSACTYVVSSSTTHFTAVGGIGSFDVSAGAACNWTVTASAGWVAFTSASAGAGNGTVTFKVEPNSAVEPRSCIVTFAGKTFTVTQAGVTVSASAAHFPAAGGTGSIDVTAGATFNWTAASAANWVVITSPSSGAGSGTVTFRVGSNAGCGSRSATLNIAGKSLLISQSGGGGDFSISTTSWAVTGQGGQTSVSVTALPGCDWAASSSREWLTVSVTGGVGSGSVTVIASANPNKETRFGTVTLAGKSFTVIQAAASCSYLISSNTGNFTATGGSGSVNVVAGADCAWNASSQVGWITISSGQNGMGGGAVAFVVAPNPDCSSRNGNLTIAGQSFTISQAGGTGNFSVNTTSVSISPEGGEFSVEVNAVSGCSWQTENSLEWVRMNSAKSVNGNDSVSFIVDSNTNCSPRIGVVSVAGKNITVTQAASNAAHPSDGVFNGLLVGESLQSKGAFSLRKRKDRFSGKITLVGQSHSFSGQFDPAGDASVLLNRGAAAPLMLQLHQDQCDPDQITGTLADAGAIIGLTADRAVYNARTNPTPLAGKYTIAIVGIEDQLFCPEGIGSATITVLANGVVRVKGTLGDGVNFSQASVLSKDGTWPFHVPLYRRSGLIAGSLGFIINTVDIAPEGDLSWSKPSNAFEKLYPAGFTYTAAVIGSSYRAPLTTMDRALDFSEGFFTLTGGDLGGGLAKDVVLMANNKVAPVLAGEDRLNFRINKRTGLFNGTIKLPGYQKMVQFKGALLQNRNAGFGLFVGIDQTGQVLFESGP